MSRHVISYLAVELMSMIITSVVQPLSQLSALAEPAQQASQAPGCQMFKETGKTVCGEM